MIIGHAAQIENLRLLSEKGLLAHAYVFFGPSDIGKFAVAKEFASYLERRGETASDEASTRTLSDAFIIRPVNGSVGIDAAREIKVFLSERPIVSSRRTVIIDDAETLTAEAQNALLKITEETPDSSLLLFIVRNPDLLWPTLFSRLQAIYFSPPGEQEVTKWLLETQEISMQDAERFASRARGKPGLALKLLRGDLEPTLNAAEGFLRVAPSGRKDFLKTLLEPEEFKLTEFLDGLLLVLDPREARHVPLWHGVVELRRLADTVPVNPRLQLMKLWMHI